MNAVHCGEVEECRDHGGASPIEDVRLELKSIDVDDDEMFD